MDLPPLEELSRSFQSVVDLTLCAICLETVSKDMIQCVNGHLLCSTCKGSQLKKCPTCQAEFSWRTPSGFIVQLLEALPPRCKHKNCGAYISKTADDDHEKFCRYRPTSCKLEGCQWTGPGEDIFDHQTKVHPKQTFFTSPCHGVSLKNFDLNKNQTQFDSFMHWDEYVWKEIIYDVDKKALIIYFHIVPFGKRKNDLFVELGACSKEMECRFRVKLNQDPDVPKEDAPYMLIPQFMLPYFVDEKKSLNFGVGFSQDKIMSDSQFF